MSHSDPAPSSERADLGDRLAALDTYLHDFHAGSGAPGMAVTLFSGDEVLYEGLFGHRDQERGHPVTADTIFGIASITKSFTVLTVLAQAAAGRLELSDPVNRHSPLDLGDDVRLEHLLSNSTGLPATPTMTWLRAADQWDDEVTGAKALAEAKLTLVRGAMGWSGGSAGAADSAAAHDDGWRAVTNAELDAAAEALSDESAKTLLASLAPTVATPEGLSAWLVEHAHPRTRPGTQYSYSNDSFALAGHVVERVSGAPFEAEVERAVLAPLGMTRTTFHLDRVLAEDDRTQIYTRDAAGEVRASPPWQTTGRMLGGGMLRSTLNDLRRYVRFLMAPEAHPGVPVPAQAVRDMRRGRVVSGPSKGYALGLEHVRDYHGVSVVTHSGSLKGVSSVMGFVPELGVGMVALCNLDGVPVAPLLYGALNAALGVDLSERAYQPAAFADDASDARAALTEFLGDYRTGEPYGRLVIGAGTDDLGTTCLLGAPDAVELPALLVRRGELALQTPGQATTLTAVRDDAGAVIGVLTGSRVMWRVTGQEDRHA